MKSKDISIFDLSPPVKLQLVEDLWDDLAANPLEVPLHDWQKQELDRRKAKMEKAIRINLSGSLRFYGHCFEYCGCNSPLKGGNLDSSQLSFYP